MARNCPDCKRYQDVIRQYADAIGEVRRILVTIHDRPQKGGRSVADRGFRST